MHRNCGRKIIRLKSVDSTHLYAVKIVETKSDLKDFDALFGGCAITAESQTAGIGRCGREWSSCSGNLFLSVIEPLFDEKNLGQVSLAVACAVHETISEFIADRNNLSLHWPNDIYYKNRKICGILISVVYRWMVISIGVNVKTTPDLDSAISIGEILNGRTPDFDLLLRSILGHLDDWFFRLKNCSFNEAKNYWGEHACQLRSSVTIKNGSDSLSGIFVEIDERGRAVLNVGDRFAYVSSGDLFVNVKNLMVEYGEKSEKNW